MTKKVTAIPVSTERLPTGAVAQRYGVSVRCVDRWWKDPDLNFPQPIFIKERKYWAVTDLEIWERGRVAENTCRPQKTERIRDSMEA
jgi:hypothetical protein